MYNNIHNEHTYTVEIYNNIVKYLCTHIQRISQLNSNMAGIKS